MTWNNVRHAACCRLAAAGNAAAAVLEECAKLTEGVVAPLNQEGDQHPSSRAQNSARAAVLLCNNLSGTR